MSEYKTNLDNGIHALNDGKLEDALEFINKSIELKNDWEISYFYRGVVNQALQNYDDAMLDYTKSTQLNPNMTDAYYNKAQITLSRKDIDSPNIEQAIKDLEKALELDEKFIDALFGMACAYKKLGDYHKSLEYLEKLLVIEPKAIHANALKKLILQKYIV
jgi:tetratricopeptide (TPR) repeat protein